jgi:hypothetical protein
MAALAAANQGASPDEVGAGLERLAAEILERTISVFPVESGTACNAPPCRP